jgi:oxygen-independent coproporphyrinogen-3 oxidase
MLQALELKPDRLVTFSYAHVPWIKKAQKKLERFGLPGAGEKQAMFDGAFDLLTKAGYKPIGLDHFVLEHDELYVALQSGQLHRNFQGYCTRQTTGQVYAVGVSAISQLQQAYAQNTKSMDEYIASVSSGHFPVVKGYRLTKQEQIIREVVTEFMCNKKLEWQRLGERLNLAPQKIKTTINYDMEALQGFENDGILELSNDALRLTPAGNLFVRNVAASFDPMLQHSPSKFSKTV